MVSIFIDSSTAIGSPAATAVAFEARLLAGDPDTGGAVTPGRIGLLSFPVGAAVGLDAPARAGGSRQQPVPVSAAGDAPLAGAQRIDAEVGVQAAMADRVVAWPHAVDVQGIAQAAVGQHDARADGGRLFRPPACRRGEEGLLGQCMVGFIGLDCRGEQYHRLHRGTGAPGEHAVQPAVVDRSVAEVGALQQFQQQAAVAGTAVDHHRGALQGAAQPPQRQAPIRAAGGDDGEQRVGVVHAVADATAGIDAHAGAHRVEREDGMVVRAGWPALVVAVHVQPGMTVAAGDPIAVLESMKMETTVGAPMAGSAAP